MYGFPLIPIYNRAQFVDKTDPCCSTSRRQGRVRTGAAMECHQDITARDPFTGPCWRCTCLPVLTLGIQCPGDAVTSILPAGIRLGRESASLVRAVKSRPQGNPTPGRRRALSCPRWSCTSFRWASEGRYRPYPPSDQRVRHRRRGWPSCTAMSILPLKRCTDSAPAPPGASGAFLGLSGLEREYGFRWAL